MDSVIFAVELTIGYGVAYGLIWGVPAAYQLVRRWITGYLPGEFTYHRHYWLDHVRMSYDAYAPKQESGRDWLGAAHSLTERLPLEFEPRLLDADKAEERKCTPADQFDSHQQGSATTFATFEPKAPSRAESVALLAAQTRFSAAGAAAVAARLRGHPAALAAAVATIQIRSSITDHRQYLKLLSRQRVAGGRGGVIGALSMRLSRTRYIKAALSVAADSIVADTSEFTSSLLRLVALLWPRRVSSELLGRFGRIEQQLMTGAERCMDASLLSYTAGRTHLVMEPLLAQAVRETELVDDRRVSSALWVAHLLRRVVDEIESPQDSPELIREIAGHLEAVWKTVKSYSTIADIVAVVLEARMLTATRWAAVSVDDGLSLAENTFADCQRYLKSDNLAERGEKFPFLTSDSDRVIAQRMAVARLYMCRVYLFAGRVDAAIAAAEAALVEAKGCSQSDVFTEYAEICLGYSYLGARRFAEAIALFEARAARLIPATVSGSETRPAHRPAKARIHGYDFFPEYVFACHLGCVYLITGRYSDAIAIYEVLLNQGRSFLRVGWYRLAERGLIVARRELGLPEHPEKS